MLPTKTAVSTPTQGEGSIWFVNNKMGLSFIYKDKEDMQYTADHGFIQGCGSQVLVTCSPGRCRTLRSWQSRRYKATQENCPSQNCIFPGGPMAKMLCAPNAEGQDLTPGQRTSNRSHMSQLIVGRPQSKRSRMSTKIKDPACCD